MAGTILGNISVGASSWVSWISAMEKTRKGFLAASLTNPATTAASSIATGSVMELSGSFYVFTDTAITLAAGTPSAAQAVYYTVIPSAGGSTVTVVMEGTAPTWVDSKQGFYASAASTVRYIGGTYIGTAATYFNKFIYTPDMLYRYLLPLGETWPEFPTVKVPTIKMKVIEIGDWNMVATTSVTINHGLSDYLKTREVLAMIRHDNDTFLYPLMGVDASGTLTGGVSAIAATAITLVRVGGAVRFDNVAFDSTSYNRGWIIIKYEA